MSRDNYIVCMDCGEWLVLGKHVRIYDRRLEKTVYGFAFISDGHNDDCEQTQKSTEEQLHRFWRYLQHFMMRHRGHELRVLPYELVGPYENDLFPQYAPGDPAGSLDYVPKENYYLSPTGIPDQDRDAKLIPESVVRRLEEMSRGEKLSKPVWDDEAEGD
jgi:hypothetical protein